MRLALSGLSCGACLAARLGLTAQRDLFIDALTKFTLLHSPTLMKFKNALALKYLLWVAEDVGDHLQHRCAAGWV